MFQLIIAILSIALIATLAIASVYYGGGAFTSASANAGAATLIAQAQQISAADTLYQSQHAGQHPTVGSDNTVVITLVDAGYLQSKPGVPDSIGFNLDLDSGNGMVFGRLKVKSVCAAINDKVGYATMLLDMTQSAASTTTAKLADVITRQYGCARDSAGNYYFGYK